MADSPVINRTPKQKLLDHKARISAHNALLNNPQLEDSIETALLEQQRILMSPNQPADGNAAASAALMLRGANHFVDIFLKLSTPPQPQAEQPKIVGLNHRA